MRLKEPKTEMGRRDITLPDIVIEALRARAAPRARRGKLTDDVLLFANPKGGPRSPHAFSKEWNAPH